jgi:hypothetical protein
MGYGTPGITTEEFQAEAKKWLASAKDPRWKRPYTELTYQPMQEVSEVSSGQWLYRHRRPKPGKTNSPFFLVSLYAMALSVSRNTPAVFLSVCAAAAIAL